MMAKIIVGLGFFKRAFNVPDRMVDPNDREHYIVEKPLIGGIIHRPIRT